jgi:hypothetical protein
VDFDNPEHFPKESDLAHMTMMDDESLEVVVLTAAPKRARVVLICPKQTKMHEWLLSFSGPLDPGEGHLFALE